MLDIPGFVRIGISASPAVYQGGERRIADGSYIPGSICKVVCPVTVIGEGHVACCGIDLVQGILHIGTCQAGSGVVVGDLGGRLVVGIYHRRDICQRNANRIPVAVCNYQVGPYHLK